MNDQDMDEAFDFKTLSLDEPEERLQKAFEHSFHLITSQDQQVPLESALLEPTLLLTEILKQGTKVEDSEAKKTENSDNGLWAKLPAPGEIHPFQLGITAEKFDAMAMDPNHVFKSAQTPFPFPFTIPPSSSDTTSGSTAIASEQGSVARKDKTEDGVTTQEEIPEWMLEDPKPTPQVGWNVTDTSGPTFTSKDFIFDWASSDDISTMIDSSIMFGFSSYPTYESLPISSVIAEEHYRHLAGLGSPSDDPSSPTSGGGFAKYGQMASGEGTGALFFGYKPEIDGTGATDLGTRQDNQGVAANLVSSTSPSKVDQQQWQTWRSEPGQAQDLHQELDLDASDAESPPFKATPGFAPALYGHD